jgi:predicted ester cyclase
MSVEANKAAVLRVFEEAFGLGDLSVIDEAVAIGGIDHQHPEEPSFTEHLKAVVTAMRTAFPDLRFDVTQIIGENDWVACYSVMTGTNLGESGAPISPGPRAIPATGRSVRVPHMHMLRMQNGQSTELLHLMDTMAMLGQLGLLPAPALEPART